MVCVVDTHTLVWYLTDSPKLGRSAAEALEQSDTELIIPTIVLAELKYLHQRRRIPLSLVLVRRMLEADERCVFYPLTDQVVDLLPLHLEMHDAIICATAMLHEKSLGQAVPVLTRDEAIAGSGLVRVIW
ncbi:MAG: PIN domain-containing protein [bacterium]